MVIIMEKKVFNIRNLMRFIFIAFVGSAIFTVVEIILAPTVAPPSDDAVRVKGDYIFLLIQCVIGIAGIIFPGFLRQKIKLSIPSVMLLVYSVFLFCALYLGFVRSFYIRVPHWDTVMHTFSGVALGALGFSVVSMLNKSKTVSFSLSPAFVAVFAFCFAVTLGVIWEIYEFAMDYFLKTNMQIYQSVEGETLIGQSALTDTMKDLIVDSIGAFVISAIGYISLKRNKDWLEQFQVKHLYDKPTADEKDEKEEQKEIEERVFQNMR